MISHSFYTIILLNASGSIPCFIQPPPPGAPWYFASFEATILVVITIQHSFTTFNWLICTFSQIFLMIDQENMYISPEDEVKRKTIFKAFITENIRMGVVVLRKLGFSHTELPWEPGGSKLDHLATSESDMRQS